MAPLWCDLGFVPNSRGNKAAANLRPINSQLTPLPRIIQKVDGLNLAKVRAGDVGLWKVPLLSRQAILISSCHVISCVCQTILLPCRYNDGEIFEFLHFEQKFSVVLLVAETQMQRALQFKGSEEEAFKGP